MILERKQEVERIENILVVVVLCRHRDGEERSTDVCVASVKRRKNEIRESCLGARQAPDYISVPVAANNVKT